MAFLGLAAKRRLLGAFGDGLMEQAFRGGRRHEPCHAPPARRLAENGHVAGVAAEGCDLVPYPFQRLDLVHRSVIADRLAIFPGFLGQFLRRKKPSFPSR